MSELFLFKDPGVAFSGGVIILRLAEAATPMNAPRYFYFWLLPIAFAVNSLISFHYPGDEYAIWVAGSFPGIWAALIKGGDIHGMKYPVVIGGALVMAFVGWRMDKSLVHKRVWLGCVVVLPFVIVLLTRPTKTEVAALLFGMVGIGLWLGSLMAILVAFVMRHWVRNTPPGEKAQ